MTDSNQRKRSRSIDLSRMRKGFAVKPLIVGMTAALLSACSDNREQAIIYNSINDCIDDNPEQAQSCQAAYEQAMQEAERTGPKYDSQRTCEDEFGRNQCYYAQTNSGSFFMPMMAGFMLGNLMSPGRYYSQPLYTSYSPYSPLRYRWMTADGYDYGDMRRNKVRVKPSAFKPKPTVSRTISRGGFGSSVRAKSSWGSSRSSKSSWGG